MHVKELEEAAVPSLRYRLAEEALLYTEAQGRSLLGADSVTELVVASTWVTTLLGSGCSIYLLPLPELPLDFLFLFRELIARAFFLASALLEAPHAWRDFNSLVGSPFESLSGPLAFPILARKEARLGLSPDFTGRFRFRPSVLLILFLPDSDSPPLGFLSEAFIAELFYFIEQTMTSNRLLPKSPLGGP